MPVGLRQCCLVLDRWWEEIANERAEGDNHRPVESSSTVSSSTVSSGGADLRHLTKLTNLVLCDEGWEMWNCNDRLHKVLLPPEIPRLCLSGQFHIVGLQVLHALDMRFAALPDPVAVVSLLRSLSPAHLVDFDMQLEVSYFFSESSNDGCLAAIADCLPRLTSLTSIKLEVSSMRGREEDGSLIGDAMWCGSLRPLRNLKRLDLDLQGAADNAFLDFSVLTSLTHLSITFAEAVNDDTVASALSRLTGLQCLHLGGVLEGFAVLPSIACLTQLRTLRLVCGRSLRLTVADLCVLSPLQQLTSLVVPLGADCTAAVVRKWLVDMPCLEAIT